MIGALHLIGSNEDCLILRENLCSGHIKRLDALFEKLTSKQKEAINILAIEEMRLNTPDNRPTFRELIKKVCMITLTKNYSNEIIAKIQMGKLMREVKRIKKIV